MFCFDGFAHLLWTTLHYYTLKHSAQSKVREYLTLKGKIFNNEYIYMMVNAGKMEKNIFNLSKKMQKLKNTNILNCLFLVM